MDLEEKLENLRFNEVIIPTHKEKLRRTLMHSDVFRKNKTRENFFQLIPLRVLLMSVIIFILFSTGIFVGINLSTNNSSTPLLTSLDSFIVKADENLSSQLTQDMRFYYIQTKITEKQQVPYEYEISYFEENWENIKNYDYWLVQKSEDNEILSERKEFDGKSYNCSECSGTFDMIYEFTKDQEYPSDYISYYSLFSQLNDQNKLSNYNSRAVNKLEELASPQTKQERQDKLKELNTIDDISFNNSYKWKDRTVYSVGYTWEYENELKEEQYIFFDLQTLEYVGYMKNEFVKGKLSLGMEIEVLKEEFRTDSFDISTENLELLRDSSKYGKGGQLEVYTQDVRNKTLYYDEYYKDYIDYKQDWDRFFDEKVNISFRKPLNWEINLVEKTNFNDVYEYRSSFAGLYFRETPANDLITKELIAQKQKTIINENGINLDIYLETVVQEEPQNYFEIKQFQILLTVFNYKEKTYVFSKLIGPEDDFEKSMMVFEDILLSIRFEE